MRHLHRVAVLAALGLLAPCAFAQTTVAGFTPGSFRVTETGAASYSIPIQVPPGIAGMVPKLAVVYNSHGGNGLLGVGWSLEGLSAIARCPKTVAQDGARAGVSYEWDARYCLDGQKLMATGGSYGGDGSVYQLERENFSRILSHGTAGNGPAWFSVKTKSGEIMEYGNTANSRIEAHGIATVRTWAVNRIADTKGNAITVTYQEDSANGQYQPLRIDYAGASVRFVYGARPDIVPLYEAGSLIYSTVRLMNVQTYLGEALVHDYQLAYEQSPSTPRFRLQGVRVCESGGNCQPSTTFGWQNGGTAFSGAAAWSGYFGPGASGWSDMNTFPRFLADVNGDGAADVVGFGADGVHVALSTRTGFESSSVWLANYGTQAGWSSNNSFPRYVVDVNGDGRADLVGFGADGVYVSLSTGSGFQAAQLWAAGYGTNVGWSSNAAYPRMLVDMNGDGRADVVGFGADGVHVSLSTGSAFGPQQLWSSAGGYNTGWNDDNTKPRVMADVNGDGMADFVGFDGGGTWVMLSTGSGLSGAAAWSWSFGPGTGWTDQNTRPRFLVDLNGDGKADIVGFDTGGAWVSLSTGTGFTAPQLWSTHGGPNEGWTDQATRRRMMVDVNGDGKADVVGFDTGGTWVMLSSGSSFLEPQLWSTAGGPNTGWTDDNAKPRFLADVDGDGRPDFVGIDGGGVWVMQVNAPVSDFVTSITTGLGAVTAIAYAPLSAGGALYAKDASSTYPMMDFQGALYVVSQVDAGNGVGGARRSTYRYVGAKADQSGRGFLGLRQFAATDVQTGIVTTTSFRQDYPYRGLASSRVQAVGANILSESTHTYLAHSLGGTRYYPYLSQSVESGSDLNGAALPSVTTTYSDVHHFGNVETIVVTTGDGYSKTTNHTYANDATNWILGRLIRSTVQRTTP